jgi:hypothetical protein
VTACGDVLWLFDGTAAGATKERMFVCLDPENGWFARIVTRQPRRDPVQLTIAAHPFLDHDSFVETGIPVEFYEGEIEEAVDRGRNVGRISIEAARRVMIAWQGAEVTPPQARDVIVRRLRETFGL